MTRPRAIVESHFPYDGPHSDERITDAAETIGDLARYLANATRHPGAISDPSTVARVVSELAAAAPRLNQALGQVADWVNQAAAGPDLRDDRSGREASDTAPMLVESITDARRALDLLARSLDEAHQDAAHLSRQ